MNEADWKLFRKRMPEWQEAYMEELNQQYAALLASSGKASEKFWKLEERINKDKNDVGVVARMSRSKMEHNILSLLDEGAITLDNLEGFSDELKERLGFLFKKQD